MILCDNCRKQIPPPATVCPACNHPNPWCIRKEKKAHKHHPVGISPREQHTLKTIFESTGLKIVNIETIRPCWCATCENRTDEYGDAKFDQRAHKLDAGAAIHHKIIRINLRGSDDYARIYDVSISSYDEDGFPYIRNAIQARSSTPPIIEVIPSFEDLKKRTYRESYNELTAQPWTDAASRQLTEEELAQKAGSHPGVPKSEMTMVVTLVRPAFQQVEFTVTGHSEEEINNEAIERANKANPLPKGYSNDDFNWSISKTEKQPQKYTLFFQSPDGHVSICHVNVEDPEQTARELIDFPEGGEWHNHKLLTYVEGHVSLQQHETDLDRLSEE